MPDVRGPEVRHSRTDGAALLTRRFSSTCSTSFTRAARSAHGSRAATVAPPSGPANTPYSSRTFWPLASASSPNRSTAPALRTASGSPVGHFRLRRKSSVSRRKASPVGTAPAASRVMSRPAPAGSSSVTCRPFGGLTFHRRG